MPTDPEQQENTTDETAVETAGILLARAREARGLDEKEVADHLHITVHYVKAIEGDKYDKLPGPVFARGYIKSYAQYLNLDVADMLARYESLQHERAPDKTLIRPARKKHRQRNLQWAIASVILFALLLGGVWMFAGQVPEQASPVMADEVSPEAGMAPADVADTVNSQQAADNANVQGSTDRRSEQSNILEQLAIANGVASPAPQESSPASIAPDETEADNAASETAEQSTGIVAAPISANAASNEAEMPLADSNSAAPEIPEQAAPEPDADSSDSGPRPEEIAAINVLEGADGERIIAVDADGSDVLRISFSGESWVEVNDGDARQIYRDLREAGDILEINGRAPFNVLLGDAPLASLRFNGNDIDVSDEIRIDNSARLTVGL